MDNVAIVGLSCLFPGADTPDAFWEVLKTGRRTTSDTTATQFGVDPAIFYDSSRQKPDTTYFLHGGYITDFESAFTDTYHLDRETVWSLHVAQAALEDSGYANANVLKQTGMILGNLSFPTRHSNIGISTLTDPVIEMAVRDLLGNDDFVLPTPTHHYDPTYVRIPMAHYDIFSPGAPAAMVAKHFGLGRLTFALDAACSSSLYAVALACNVLNSGRADMMLAGAVSAADPMYVNMGFAHLGGYPRNGRPHGSRPLDGGSDGLIAGEGAGMFVLKRYADAVRDGDHIYAVVRGYGLANDGRGKHILTPNSKGQVQALARAYQAAGIDRQGVDYVEHHASGTTVGDKTELHSMEQFWDGAKPPKIGSVKSNVGHLLTAAGMASMTKIILSLANGILPPTIGIEHPMQSPGKTFGSEQIIVQPTAWRNNGQPRRAGVNAFGFGGVSSHLILEEHIQQEQQTIVTQKPEHKHTRLAIIGMDAHFGPLEGLDNFHRAIYDGETAFIDLPERRWKGVQNHYLPDWLKAAPQGAYIESFDIDFMKYRIPPHPDDEPIPQQLLLLKVADNAIRDAGLKEGSNVAVIVALGTELALHQYRARVDLSWQVKQALEDGGLNLPPEQRDELERIAKDSLLSPAQVNHYTSYIGNITANRVSALWDFSGPSFTLSSEENSVFKALEVAELMLANGEAEAVVVGAVDLAGSLESVLVRSELNHLHDGAPAAGIDVDSNGWMVGEGAGAVVLRRADQTPDEDAYATIDALALVQEGGQSPDGLPTAPTANAIAQAAREALHIAGVTSNDVGYIEMHSSGIAQQDKAEINAITDLYRGDDLRTAFGTVKANIGHTYAASGMASLIKAALTVSERFIPAIPNWNAPELPDVWQGTTLWVATKSRTWFDEKRVAAVNSLGADGAAGHLILSNAVGSRRTTSFPGRTYLQSTPPYLFPLSGNDAAALTTKLNTLADALKTDDLLSLADEVYAGYDFSAPYCVAIVGKNAEEVRKQVAAALDAVPEAMRSGGSWSTPVGSAFVSRPVGHEGDVAFVYPGAFNAYPKLGYELLHLFPETYSWLQAIKSDVGDAVGEKFLYPRTLAKPGVKDTRAMKNNLIDNSPIIIESGLSFAVLFTRAMTDYFDVQPRAAFGYSLGESGMMWGLGVWRDGDEGSRRLRSSDLFVDRLVGPMKVVRESWGIPPDVEDIWAAYFIAAPVEHVKAVVDRHDRVYITHINTPTEVMIAGDPETCKQVITEIDGETMRAPFSMVIHNDTMLSEYQEYTHIHDFAVHPEDAQGVTFYSAADYRPVTLERKALANSIARMVCKPIDFPRLVRRAYNDGVRIFLELGPRSTCARWINESLGDLPHLAVSIDNLGTDNKTSIVRMLAQMVTHRVPVNLSPLYQVSVGEDTEKSLVRRVYLGGSDIYNNIVNDENRAKFGQMVTATPSATSSPALAAPTGQLTALPTNLSSVHTEFLRSRQSALRQMGDVIQMQIEALRTGASVAEITPAPAQHAAPVPDETPVVSLPSIPPANPAPAPSKVKGITPDYDNVAVRQFAIGRVADCFGEKYAIYDNRRAPRIPNGDLLLFTRAVKITGERFKSVPGTSIHAEYDVPEDMWFYKDNAYPTMPYSVYMEIALQPCGFLSAHHGPTLAYPDIDFYFRNLDGNGILHKDVDMRGRTITNHVTLLRNTILQGTIIQSFSFKLYDGDDLPENLFYDGEATFGYFTLQALDSQAGLDKGEQKPRWLDTVSLSPSEVITVDPSQELGEGYLKLAHGMLELTNEIKVVPGGGTYGEGYAYANTVIDPEMWFFFCHFHQDPVMPGSIGVETMLQALQSYVIKTGIADEFTAPYFAQTDGGHEVVWKYRGQILSNSEKSHVEVNIKRVERENGKITLYADGSLWRDQLRIYEVNDLALTVRDLG